MKLRNKKTGEIEEFENITRVFKFIGNKNTYNFLTELNAEWEDCKEPKEYWCIDWTGGINHITVLNDMDEYEENKKQIGNYFDTREEAEQAVEKLKAWKRLQDTGVTFQAKVIDYKWYLMPKTNDESVTFKEAHDLYKDIDLVFGVKHNEGDS